MKTDGTGSVKKGRGRPKVFDRNATLDKAMALFWQYGYEATSLSELVAVTGAKAPTLYAEFTNKEGLFRAVLDRYETCYSEQHKAALLGEEKSVEQALLDYFTAISHSFASADTPAGCFLINTSSTVAASSQPIAGAVMARHASQEQTLLAFLQQSRMRGELPASCNVPVLAQFLSCIVQGMSVSAREGAGVETLMQIVDTTRRLWPALLAEGVQPDGPSG